MLMGAGVTWLAPGLWLVSFLSVRAADLTPVPDPASGPTQNVAVVPFEFRRGHIMIPSRVNGSSPFSFMLDTGFSMTMIGPAQAETLQLKRVGEVTIVGVAGEEIADVFAGPTFDFSGRMYSPRRVASLPSDRRNRKRDGVLGYGFFKRFVVEIDHAGRTLRLHEPQTFQYSADGEVIPLTFRKTTPIVEAWINQPDRPPIKAWFEIDTGCDGCLCLGHDFAASNQLLPPESARGGAKQGVGGDAQTIAGHVPQLQLGRNIIDRPAVDFFQKGSPVDAGLAGHIGIEILRKFKVIFDYSRERMILEKVSP